MPRKLFRTNVVAVIFVSLFSVSGVTPAHSIADGPFPCGGSATYDVTGGVASAGTSCSGSLALDNSVTSIATGAFKAATGLTSVTIPEGVTSIGTEAFRNTSSLRSVSLPSTLTSLTDQAFRESGLTSVTIPSTVTYVGYLTFANATRSLTSITFIGGNSDLEIRNEAFQGGGYTSITLPSNLKVLNPAAFTLSRLQTIRFLGNAPTVATDFTSLPTPLPTVYTTATATGFTSPWKSLTVVSPPSPPTSLAGTAGDGVATIAFTPGAINGAAISNYEYSTDGTNYTAFSPAITSSPVSISGLTNGTTYSIFLKAVNAAGAGLASSSVNVTPTAPVNVTNSDAAETARIAAAQAEAARKAREQQELIDILALIPKIGELTLSLGETTKSLYSTKCVKGKSTKFVKKGAKCPRGFARK
jgi:hypothetical protein